MLLLAAVKFRMTAVMMFPPLIVIWLVFLEPWITQDYSITNHSK